MKTILDAVNILKGVWPSDAIQIIEINGVEFSEKEFSDCVTECSNNFGLPSVTTIDWSKAPEYYDYFLVNKLDSTSNGFCHKLSDGRFSFEDGSVTSHNEAFNIHHKPINHIYTQAMFDAGELPKIGMKCKIFYNEEGSRFNDFFDVEITILAITGDVFTFESSLFGLGALKLKSKMLSAIDNRTPKEKADDLFKLYLKGEQVSTHKSFSQAAIDGDFGDNIKWVK